MASASPAAGEESTASVRRYSDREQSWLAFNRRVLELAQDPVQPLLERAKFCAIYSSNLDEFFMVRVAGLKRRISAGIAVRNASGDAPRDVYAAILTEAREQMRQHAITYRDEIAPALAEEGIEVVRWRALTDDERKRMEQLFIDQVFPVLTPLAVDPAHPFPYISGLSLNLAVVVRNPETRGEHFARVKVPQVLPRFYRVNEQRFVPLEDVIAAHLDQLFPGMQVLSHYTFRVTRNEDVSVEEDDAENLLHAMETELTRRRFGPPVRLEIGEDMDPHVLDLLIRELGVHETEVFALPEPLDLTGLWALHGLDRGDLKDPAFVPRTSIDLSEVETSEVPDIFAVARDRDVLLHHPYESFSTSVQAFLDQAARDPDVLAIKQTLYRTSADSPIVDALIDAADAGKQVLALVEIKARFDEQANIRRARKLEEAGCHVVYGVVGLKTHCKASLVVRREGDTIRRYTHIGTGNYHPKTARLYEDLGLITADPMVADDVTHLFNVLSGYSRHTEYGRLLVAPHSIRDGLIARIEAEIDHHRAGRPAGIRFKVNSIVDERTMDALYAAADAGVPVEVWVRGICGLRAGVPGLSESNLRVRSILGRFLEHSRIYWFASGGRPQVWIGSADLMHRNLDRRVEALVSIADPEHVQRLTQLLDLGLSDDVDAWHLQPDDTWGRTATAASGERLTDIQDVLLANRGWAP
jgi:polyphosphate kinase